MAHLIPSDLAPEGAFGSRRQEIETARRLQRELSDAFTVFHSVHWSNLSERGRRKIGEVDFVVVNRDGDALFIEQKNGPLEVQGGDLVKVYSSGPKRVRAQVERSAGNVQTKFERRNRGARLRIRCLVYCPDHRVADLNAAGLEDENLVDARTRGRLAEKVAALLGEGRGGEASAAHSERVRGFFRQELDLVPDVHSFLAQQDASYTRLVGELVDLLDGIEMEPLRLWVRGTAGCGKTQIAARFFERSCASGLRPLYVCYNRPLAERMRRMLPAAGFADTLFGLVKSYRDARRDPMVFPGRATARTWERAMEKVIGGGPILEGWRFDLAIVDEAQDLTPLQRDFLELFVADGGAWLVLEDPDQNLRGAPPAAAGGFVGYRCRKNFRSPRSIAPFIREVSGVEFECASPLPGLGVRVRTCADERAQRRQLGAVLTELVREGFGHQDVAVLTGRHMVEEGAPRSALQSAEKVGSFRLRRFTGRYDEAGGQVYTDGEIRFDSLYRFKGQQAPAIVLVDVDRAFAESESYRAALFSALTRATARLEVLVSEDHPERDRLVEAAS